MKSTLIGLTLAAATGFSIGCLSGTATAATFFNSRTAWETALGSSPLITETFDSPQSNAATLTFASGLVSTGSGGNTFNAVTSGRYSGNVDTLNPAANTFDQITWSFSQPILAFGVDWFAAAQLGDVTVTGNFDGPTPITLSLASFLGGNGTGFLGVIGTVPFAQIVLSTEDPAGNEFFEADNLALAPAAVSVPVPPAVPGVMAFAAIAAWKLKRRQSSGRLT